MVMLQFTGSLGWHWGGCPGSFTASQVSSEPKPSTVNHTTIHRSKYAAGGSQVLSRVGPRRRPPSHPSYILRTASGQLNGHNSYSVVGVFLWISLYENAHNYTAV